MSNSPVQIIVAAFDDADSAEEALKQAVRYQPDFALGHFALADLLYQRAEIRQATEHAQLAVDLDPENAAAQRLLQELSRRANP